MKPFIHCLICTLRWHDLESVTLWTHRCKRCGEVLTLRQIAQDAGIVDRKPPISAPPAILALKHHHKDYVAVVRRLLSSHAI
jgi:hypothetical protein